MYKYYKITLFKEGAKVDTPQRERITPFLRAYSQGKHQVAYDLLDEGADVNHVDAAGNFALKYAVQ